MHKKQFIIFLATLMLFSNVAFANASLTHEQVVSNIYLFENEISHEAYIDESVMLNYYFTDDQEKAISISYTQSAKTDTYIYNESEGVMYKNGEIFATIQGTTSTTPVPHIQNSGATTNWVHEGTTVSSVTFDPGLDNLEFAVFTILYFPYITPQQMLTRLGVAAIRDAIEYALGGVTFEVALYTRRIDWRPISKFEFTISLPNGNEYGPISYVEPVRILSPTPL